MTMSQYMLRAGHERDHMASVQASENGLQIPKMCLEVAEITLAIKSIVKLFAHTDEMNISSNGST